MENASSFKKRFAIALHCFFLALFALGTIVCQKSMAEPATLKAYIKKPNVRDLGSSKKFGTLLNPAPSIDFGYNFSASANFLAVAAPGARKALEPVYYDGQTPMYEPMPEIDIFEKVNSKWKYMATVTPESTGLLTNLHPKFKVQGFGYDERSISISGNTLATTIAWWNREATLRYSGIAIFELSPQRTWKFKQFFYVPSNIPSRVGCPNDGLAIDYTYKIKLVGNYLAVTDGAGKQALHIFSKDSAGNWQLFQTLYGKDAPGSDQCILSFGKSLEGYPGGFIVGTLGSGAYLAEYINNRWAFTQRFFPPKLHLKIDPRFESFNGHAGWEVAATRDFVLLSVPNDAASLSGVFNGVPSSARIDEQIVGDGAIYAWTRRNGTWIHSHYIKPPRPFGTSSVAGFGVFPISVSSNRLVIGGYGSDQRTQGAYFYRRKSNGAIAYEGLIASPNQKIGSSRAPIKDFFGFGVGIQLLGSSIFISWPSDQSAEKTIRNDGTFASDRTIYHNGAMFVYE